MRPHVFVCCRGYVGATQHVQTFRSGMHRTFFYSCPGTLHTNQKAVNALTHVLWSFATKIRSSNVDEFGLSCLHMCVCVNMFLPFFKAYAANFFELTVVQQLR